MKQAMDTSDRLRRHLTGTTSEAERQELELAVLEDDELFERLEAAEDDLIDQYVRGELDEGSTRRIAALVESSPRLRAKEETTLALGTWHSGASVDPTKTSAPPQPVSQVSGYHRLAWGAAITAALVLTAWLLVQTASLKASATTLAAENRALRERVETLEKTVSQLEDSNRSLARRLARSESEDR